MSKNLNPRVESMIALSPFVLLLKEAAARCIQAPFSKGNVGLKKAGSGVNTAQSKQSICHKTKYIRVYHIYVTKIIVPKVPAVNLRLFTKNNPVTVCPNGTYHAIVGRARRRSAIVAVLV